MAAEVEDDATTEVPVDDPIFTGRGTDESQVLPTRSGRPPVSSRDPERTRNSQVGAWNANISYSLRRPRFAEGNQVSQMIQGSLNFQPTEFWDVRWRTSYDVQLGSFRDHVLSLTRELHRWEATFDFRQTATGNWTFRFQVSLTDNRDLKFDYEQRNLVVDPNRSRFGGF